MMTASTAEVGVLTYASPNVRSSPPRTFPRMFLAAIGWAFGIVLTALRLCVIAAGYAVLGAGIALRFVFAFAAMILLFVGGLRWEVVKRRTLGGAQWVDAKVLGTMAFFRRRRLLPRSAAGGDAR